MKRRGFPPVPDPTASGRYGVSPREIPHKLKPRARGRGGFTLIELLVVITIIAILSAIGLSSFANTQRRARDSRRRGDMKQIQNAMEQYYITNNQYIGAYTALPTTSWSSGSYPLDPRTSAAYGQSVSSTTAYTICADFEMTAAGAINASWTGSRTSGSDIFCVSNLQ